MEGGALQHIECFFIVNDVNGSCIFYAIGTAFLFDIGI